MTARRAMLEAPAALAAGGRRVLLKARPTETQLADRLAAPVPDGVELYIHEQDVSGDAWLQTLRRRFAALTPPSGFLWIVEGPVWSLDGALFGLWRNAPCDRDLVQRLVDLAQAIGAPALNIHCVEGSEDPSIVGSVSRVVAVERAAPFLEWYVSTCRSAGIMPLIENVPPICRMRRAAFIYTPLGVHPEDLAACARAFPGLRVTLDTSHAQLAVNAYRGCLGSAAQAAKDTGAGLTTAVRRYQDEGGPASLEAYLTPLLPWTTGVHVSNAAGVLDEGLPYGEGDADLDHAVRLLAPHAAYFVTEPLDEDEDHPTHKRQMQQALSAALAPQRAAGAASR